MVGEKDIERNSWWFIVALGVRTFFACLSERHLGAPLSGVLTCQNPLNADCNAVVKQAKFSRSLGESGGTKHCDLLCSDPVAT